jgi:hypothetical protein
VEGARRLLDRRSEVTYRCSDPSMSNGPDTSALQ